MCQFIYEVDSIQLCTILLILLFLATDSKLRWHNLAIHHEEYLTANLVVIWGWKTVVPVHDRDTAPAASSTNFISEKREPSVKKIDGSPQAHQQLKRLVANVIQGARLCSSYESIGTRRYHQISCVLLIFPIQALILK